MSQNQCPKCGLLTLYIGYGGKYLACKREGCGYKCVFRETDQKHTVRYLTSTSEIMPARPQEGDLWYNKNRLYVYTK